MRKRGNSNAISTEKNRRGTAVARHADGSLTAFPATAAGKTDLYVGYDGKANNFATVQAAVNQAAR